MSICPSVRPSVKRVNCDKTKAPSEKNSIMINRKLPTSFPMSLRWTSYGASKPPKGGQTRKKNVFCQFSLGISKNVCYKVALCANSQRQSCKAFTGPSIRAQIVGGGPDIPLKANFVREGNHPLARRRCILWHFNCCLPLYTHLGGKITPQATFAPVSLEPWKLELCAFVTFPEYGWATKWRIYRKYMCNQKSKMAARKLKMICRLTLVKISTSCLEFYVTRNVISTTLRIFSRSWRSVASMDNSHRVYENRK